MTFSHNSKTICDENSALNRRIEIANEEQPSYNSELVYDFFTKEIKIAW